MQNNVNKSRYRYRPPPEPVTGQPLDELTLDYQKQARGFVPQPPVDVAAIREAFGADLPESPEDATAARRSPDEPSPLAKFLTALHDYEADAFTRGFAAALSRFRVLAAEHSATGRRVKKELATVEAEWRRLTNSGQKPG